METIKPKYYTIDYVFWILLVFFSNPGGILDAIGLKSSEGSASVKDLIFFALLGLFFLISYKVQNETFIKIIKYLVVFLLYYFLVFGYFTPIFKDVSNYSYLNFLKKNRTTLYSAILFVIVYFYYIRSNVLFYKTLIITTIIILSLFLISYLTGVNIIPYEEIDRRFIDVKRIFLISYGDFFLLVPFGFVVIVFMKKTFKWKKYILMAFSLTGIAILLTITRRHLLGFFIYFFITTVLFNYMNKKPLVPIKKVLSVAVYIVLFGFILSLSLPKYIEAAKVGFEESINVIDAGETSAGTKDVRLGFGKEFMQDLIINNLYFGTGFDNRWRTKEGDTQGYEASDYPLLGAIAMTGIIGVLFFLPIYIVLIRSLIYDLKFLRNNNVDYYSIEFLALLTFIIYFIYHIMQYINWFIPVSLSGRSFWYIYLAMYYGSREVFYKKYTLVTQS